MELRELETPISALPFEDSVDTTFFFAGGARGEIVDEIKRALIAGVGLITLVGAEGSGKTMICRMVVKEAPAGLQTVYLGEAVESFGDMVNIVGRQVLGDSEKIAKADTRTLLQLIAESLREREQRLLIVFEEAEKIYLATLERIRRMLDKVNENEQLLHIIFSGRSSLAKSLEQLGIVAFRDIAERNFVLGELDRDATEAYLQQQLATMAGRPGVVFDGPLIDTIFAVSAGNFRLINQEARKQLELATDHEPSVDLLDADDSGEALRDQKTRSSRIASASQSVNLDFLQFPKLKSDWVFYGGALLAIGFLLFMVFGRLGERPDDVSDRSEVPPIILQEVDVLPERPSTVAPVEQGVVDIVESAEPTEPSQSLDESLRTALVEESESPTAVHGVKEETVAAAEGSEELPFAAVTEEEVSPFVVPEETPRSSESGSLPAVDPEEAVGVATVHDEEEDASDEVMVRPVLTRQGEKKVYETTGAENELSATEVAQDSEADRTISDQESAAGEAEVADRQVEQPVAETVYPVVVQPVEQKEIVRPSPVAVLEDIKKRGSGSKEESSSVSAESVSEAMLPAVPIIEEPAIARNPVVQPPPAPTLTVPFAPVIIPAETNALYQERLAAGARWLVGGGSGRYTVQLMVLTSDQAEDNLKQVLADKDYRAIADDLFVLRRLGSPPTVMLYYGEYRTLDAAQRARNTLPVFLRKHDPYPISVNAAVEKTRTM